MDARKYVKIRGARTHNLQNIDVDLPRDELVVITGLSGSGKSSLAFDTLYAEGQRRYVESLTAYARQFLELMPKPDVDQISGLSPAIAIEQKSTSHNTRSTVGTITEIYDYLRLLFAKIGEMRCPQHQIILKAYTISEIVDSILALPADTKIIILAPLAQVPSTSNPASIINNLHRQGFVRLRLDATIYEIEDITPALWDNAQRIDVVIDRLRVAALQQTRIAESVATAIQITHNLVAVALADDIAVNHQIFATQFACPHCDYAVDTLTPQLFSFNNPQGACANCHGLGRVQQLDLTAVVKNPNLSLAQGAINGWDNKHAYYHQMLTQLAMHYHFSMHTPFNELSSAIQNLILYGDNSAAAHRNPDTKPFVGVLAYLERRYSNSEWGRAELAKYFVHQACPSCNGSRLNDIACNVVVAEHDLPKIVAWPISTTLEFFTKLTLSGNKLLIADKILQELRQRLGFLVAIGLDYLSLNRGAETLSGGEAQRIRLASQIGSGLVGVMYILDEPSIGLHQRDNDRLLNVLSQLRDLGNTVIVIEHDEDAIRAADYIVDLGPGAGVNGGHLIAHGNLEAIINAPNSLTGQYLSGALSIPVPVARKEFDHHKTISIIGATGHNLHNVTVHLPIGLLCGITGVSGSGKSTLINGTLQPIAAQRLNGARLLDGEPCKEIHGLEHCDKLVVVDQSPIGRTPRSNPATYTGVLNTIRELFAHTPAARSRGYKEGRFSFNVPGGRCEACQGDGVTKISMHFLADVYVKCEVCRGQRYNRETLEIKYKGYNIAQILDMNISQAREFFTNIPALVKKLGMLIEVGLGYLALGQNATTLSGGEAQRIKLAKELARRDTGKTLFLLDEPTTGLHFHDVAQLLTILQRLRDHGNTVIIIEHNLDIIKSCDWLIDLGPEGGAKGGTIVASGTPEQVAQIPHSHTGQFLRKLLYGKT